MLVAHARLIGRLLRESRVFVSFPFCGSNPLFLLFAAFFAHGNDQSSSGGIWCGYAASNTAYRLLIAALTVFWAIAVAVPGVANGMGKTYFYVTLFVGALWFCATTADCTAVAMANGVCRNFFGGPNAADYGIAGVYSCESEYYGITITLDFVLSSTLLGALLLFEDDTVSAEYSPPPAKAAPQEEEEPEKPADNMA